MDKYEKIKISTEMEEKFKEIAPQMEYLDFTGMGNEMIDEAFSITAEEKGEYELHRGIRAYNEAEIENVSTQMIKNYIERRIDETATPNFNFVSYRKVSILSLRHEYNLNVYKKEDIENLRGKTLEDNKFIRTLLEKEKIKPAEDPETENHNKNIIFLRYHIMGRNTESQNNQEYCVPGRYFKDQKMSGTPQQTGKAEFVINAGSKSYISEQIDYEIVGDVIVPTLNLYVVPVLKVPKEKVESETRTYARGLTKSKNND